MSLKRYLASLLLAAALPAAAQSVVPAANYTDMWWNPNESGWGLSFAQHGSTNQVFAVWYTYDPREQDGSGQFKPLWIVMPGGTWSSPTSLAGDVYVTHGTPFSLPFGGTGPATRVGTFTFNFSNSANGTFAYSVAAPAGVASNDPAFGLPAMSGTKTITRQSF